MKSIHTAILDQLFNYFSYNQAVELTECILEYFNGNMRHLRADIIDHMSDFFAEEDSMKIADACIGHI